MAATQATDSKLLNAGDVAFGIREHLLEAMEADHGGMLADMICRIASFEEAGLLTSNEGLVIRLDDGTEYQLTVVRSK